MFFFKLQGKEMERFLLKFNKGSYLRNRKMDFKKYVRFPHKYVLIPKVLQGVKQTVICTVVP